MDGYYTFRYLRPDEIPSEEPENIEDIDPSLIFTVNVSPIQLRLREGQQFVANPNFTHALNLL